MYTIYDKAVIPLQYMYNIQYTIYNIQYMYNIQYTIYNIQYTIYNIQYASMNYMLLTIYQYFQEVCLRVFGSIAPHMANTGVRKTCSTFTG